MVEQVFEASDELALRASSTSAASTSSRCGGAACRGWAASAACAAAAEDQGPGFLIFNQELAALLKAGLPLLQALELMLERLRDQHFKAVLTDIRDRVKSGEDLSEAFAAHGELFPRLYPSTLKAGERSGELESVIRRFIRYMRLVLDARKRVVSALVYPAVLVGLSVTMIVIMMIYVVPRFMGFFAELEAELPLITRITLGSRASPAATGRSCSCSRSARSSSCAGGGGPTAGRVALDRWKLAVPLLGGVLHRFALSEFCRSLGDAARRRHPAGAGLRDRGRRRWATPAIRQRIEPRIQMVREGKPFHAALEDERGVHGHVDRHGQGGGGDRLARRDAESVSEFLDEEVETRMQRILALIEPLMLVIMGIIIAILLVSIYLPLFGLLGQANQ